MTKPGRRTLLLIGTPLLAALLAAGGYVTYRNIEQQHEENLKTLERFGFGITPSSPYTESIGELGTRQLPATFAEDKLTPTQKVIYSLVRDKQKLLDKNRELQQRIDSLEQQIGELEKYRKLNERFAPRTFDEEVAKVGTDLKAYLLKLPEAERFSSLQIDIMTEASIREYRRFVKANRLLLDQPTRVRIVNEKLPGFAFCIGEGINIAANSTQEVQQVARYLNSNDASTLSAPLRRDLQTVMKPCQQALRQSLAELLKP